MVGDPIHRPRRYLRVELDARRAAGVSQHFFDGVEHPRALHGAEVDGAPVVDALGGQDGAGHDVAHVRPVPDLLDRILIAVAFTLVNVALLALFSREVRRGFDENGLGIRLSARVVGLLLLISVFTGLLGGVVADSDWPLRWGLTQRTGQYSVWITTMRQYKKCKQDQ